MHSLVCNQDEGLNMAGHWYGECVTHGCKWLITITSTAFKSWCFPSAQVATASNHLRTRSLSRRASGEFTSSFWAKIQADFLRGLWKWVSFMVLLKLGTEACIKFCYEILIYNTSPRSTLSDYHSHQTDLIDPGTTPGLVCCGGQIPKEVIKYLNAMGKSTYISYIHIYTHKCGYIIYIYICIYIYIYIY